MSNEKVYVSSLERQLPEFLPVAKRRCKEYDGKIDKHNSYHRKNKSADHHGADASAAASAAEEMKREIVQCNFQFYIR